ncbi:hypothetical protein GMO_18030 [Gluconobacter morbifer G707]|uniref:Uncharacterized protein n=1 Tax=Gluconobacter morbifer G707 TaxID=1088869 RepID=G6XJD1_9PROT|nr:hypothetical protein GMO_18030 [Gluconobacter morbifer G707]
MIEDVSLAISGFVRPDNGQPFSGSGYGRIRRYQGLPMER